MKAIVIHHPGPAGTLKLTEKQPPEPQTTEVLIEVKAAGINRPDIFQRKGNYPAPPGVPQDIPGLEVAGIVKKCGSEVKRWKPGDRVCALLGGGGYAEFAVASENHCLPVPEPLTFIEAASLPETVFTVWHNVFQRGMLREKQNFLVHGGSGGIGITAIQIARAFGANVYATAGSDEKCRFCEELGTVLCINYKRDDFELALKKIGIDVILDMIGGDYTPKNISLLNNEGKLVFINAMKGGRLDANVFTIMQKRITITGSTLRPRDAKFKAELAADVEKQVWPLIYKKKFKPVIYKVFDLAEADKAQQLMESGHHIGKIILQVN